MKAPSLIPVVVACAGMLLPANPIKANDGPEWQTDWQYELSRWLQSLTEKDLHIDEKDFLFHEMDPAEKNRNWLLAQSYGPNLSWANLTIKMPAAEFLWPSIWRSTLPANQKALKDLGVENGQIWTPIQPALSCTAAWLYSWDRPWNPYHKNPALAKRAAVTSAITLIMARAVYSGRLHTGTQGFGLTFNAFTYQYASDALPESTRRAWEQGLRWYAEAMARSSPNGPENMQLSAPVGIYQTGLALNDENLKKQGLRSLMEIFANHYSLAGYIRDAGVPDASYNGISLHRLAEYWAISQSAEVLDILRAAYRLKGLNVLPEPNGYTLSPSHFNARCQDGFDYDQYQGREVMILPEVPEAAYFARRHWGLEVTVDEVAEVANRNLMLHATRFPPPIAWGTRYGGLAPHDWGRVLALPYVMYHSSDPVAAEKLIREAELPHILRYEHYTESLGGEFHFIRRPGYGAIFYTGPAVPYDNGATNLNGVLKNEGGYHMGFGGGGLSAFWTPKGGSLILGRMSGREAYFRLRNVGNDEQFTVWGWQDWLNNQLVGETMEGKVVTSSRCAIPQSRMNKEAGLLEIQGEMPKKSRRQGDIIEAQMTYQRAYRFSDDKIECTISVTSDQPLELRNFYEALPLVESSGRPEEGVATTVFLDAQGNEIAPDGDSYKGVYTVRHERFEGGVRIVFPAPVTIARTSEAFPASQFRRMMGRSLLIEMPSAFSPDKPVQLSYHLYPESK